MKLFLYGKAKKIAKIIKKNNEKKEKKITEPAKEEMIPYYLWPFLT